MNKHIIKALEKYDFTYEKNKGYGHIEDYEVNIINVAGLSGPVFYFSTFLSQTKKNEFILKFNENKFKYCQSLYFDFGVAVIIGSFTPNQFEEKFNEVMPKILEILADLGATNRYICPQSGEEITMDNSTRIYLYQIEGYVTLTNSSSLVVRRMAEKANENFKNAPNNYGKGFLGILIGALAGVVLTVVFEFIGLISWLAPLASVTLGIFLYKKFGGKPNGVMTLMSFVTTFVTIFLAVFITYIVVCSSVCAESNYDVKGIEALQFVMDNVEGFTPAFIRDFVVNGILIIAVEVIYFISIKSKRAKIIGK